MSRLQKVSVRAIPALTCFSVQRLLCLLMSIYSPVCLRCVRLWWKCVSCTAHTHELDAAVAVVVVLSKAALVEPLRSGSFFNKDDQEVFLPDMFLLVAVVNDEPCKFIAPLVICLLVFCPFFFGVPIRTLISVACLCRKACFHAVSTLTSGALPALRCLACHPHP